MFKKVISIAMSTVLMFSVAVCGSAEEAAVTLTEDEAEVLELMGEDIIVVTDEDYAETVDELANHTGEFNGKVYQFEGVYSVDDSAEEPVPGVSRTLVNGDEETVCGLPLVYQEKEIEAGSWVRVTGIVNEGEINGENMNVLEVVAIEVLAEEGNAELEWEGSAHEH